MLKKALRIRKKEDFDRVFRLGKPLSAGLLACRILPSPHTGFRLGFSLSARLMPRAVDRNRLRRIIAAAVADGQVLWPENTDVVFYARRPLPRNTILAKKNLAGDIQNLLSRMSSKKKTV